MILKDRRIFFVEDDGTNVAVLKTVLEQNGAKVSFERWGEKTIHALKTFAPIDVILLDLMLPNDISGFDLIALIRQVPEFDSIPIVAVSASDPAIAMKRAKQSGFNGFISKPIQWGLFERQVASVIAGGSVWYAR